MKRGLLHICLVAWALVAALAFDPSAAMAGQGMEAPKKQAPIDEISVADVETKAAKASDKAPADAAEELPQAPVPGKTKAKAPGGRVETLHLPSGVDIDVSIGPPGSANGGPVVENGKRILALKDCVALALQNNQRIKAAAYDIEAAKGQLTEAGALFMPVVEYWYRVAPVPTNVDHALGDFFNWQVTLFNGIHVGIGIPLLTFGQLNSAKKMAEGGVEAARVNEGKARETVVFQVKQLYYGALLAKEIIRLLEDATGKIKNKVADEEAKTKQDMDPYDLLKLKTTRVDLERRLAESKQNLDLAYEGLRVNLNLEPGEPIDLDADGLHPELVKLGTEQEYIDAAIELQPESKLIDIGVAVKRDQYKLEKFKLLPKAGLGFFVEVGRTMGPIQGVQFLDDYNNPFNYSRAGVGVQLKGDLDFHGAAGRIKKARSEYFKASYERLIAKRGLALEIRRAYLNAKRAQDDVARAKRAESLSRQMVFFSKVNVDMGIGDNQRFGDALLLYLVNRGYYFKSIFDYNIALADLQQRIGKARYEELTPAAGEAEYDLFDTAGEENGGFETYGIDSEAPPEHPAGRHPALMEGVKDATKTEGDTGNKGDSDADTRQ